MRVLVDTATPQPVVAEGADLNRLEVVVTDDGGSVGEVLLRAGIDYDGEHAWLAIAWLRDAARPPADADWDGRFDGMISYATSKNWVDDARLHVRAHVTSPDHHGAGRH